VEEGFDRDEVTWAPSSADDPVGATDETPSSPADHAHIALFGQHCTMVAITEHTVGSTRHRTAYLQAGAESDPLVVLFHGWPERAISWRHQITHLAELGYLVVAPDMRGYGNSELHAEHRDCAIEEIVGDMLELLGHFGRTSAIWIGHDWGSPVVWSIASHHPEAAAAVASLCVPYHPGGFTLENLVALVDRDIYPADQFPAGQWEYFLFYREQFERAHEMFEANVANTVTVLFRRGNPDAIGQPAALAFTRIRNGWFGSASEAPDLPIDTDVLDRASFDVYVEGLSRNGFAGPASWYMNDELNAEYASRSLDGGRLDIPVLFIHARYDQVCETLLSKLAQPMRASCRNLDEAIVDSGHWMAQEQPAAVNTALETWLSGLD
jgi:pimeloyl-ACP methyl ester carboxylesterase